MKNCSLFSRCAILSLVGTKNKSSHVLRVHPLSCSVHNEETGIASVFSVCCRFLTRQSKRHYWSRSQLHLEIVWKKCWWKVKSLASKMSCLKCPLPACVCLSVWLCVCVLETQMAKRVCLFMEVQIFSDHLFLTTILGSTAVTFTYFNILLCLAHIFNNLHVWMYTRKAVVLRHHSILLLSADGKWTWKAHSLLV